MNLYNKKVADHYAAYRPPLHTIILNRVLSDSPTFSNGLDVGCGTGYSTIALSGFCDQVVGIDPSQSMLNRATEHPGIIYKKGSGEDIPFADGSFDIVTLAGSLFYMDVNVVASELKRVCKNDAIIIPYDFVVLLDDVLDSFDIKKEEKNSEYDPRVNFLGIKSFDEITSREEQIELNLSPSELTHVLLSDHFHFKAFSKKYSSNQPFEKLRNELKEAGDSISIPVDLFYSKYRLTQH